MVAVDGGSTAKYGYDASNHRVRLDIWSGAFEELYNLTGQKVVIWNAGSGSVMEEDTHLGAQPLAAYLGGALFFEHQDWLGTERVLTDGAGNTAGSYLSLPFGDGFTDDGTDLDPYHFAGLDHDYESGLDHGQFREYSSAGGRWLSPDPYSGSYDWSNPQSLNRYAYALNNPLSMSDPTGEDGCGDDFDWEDDDFGYGITGPGGEGSGPSGINNNAYTFPLVQQYSWVTDTFPTDNFFTEYSTSGAFGLVWSSGGGGGGGGAQGLAILHVSRYCGVLSNCKTPSQCAAQAIAKNAVSLGLDAAGVGAGFLPGGDLAVAGVQMGLGVASTVNSAVSGDAPGSIGSVFGLQLSALAPAAKWAGVGAKAVPFLGAAVSAAGALNDPWSTYKDYQGCMAGH